MLLISKYAHMCLCDPVRVCVCALVRGSLVSIIMVYVYKLSDRLATALLFRIQPSYSVHNATSSSLTHLPLLGFGP